MTVFFYILKLSVGLIIIWLFYQLVLRRLTFYAWNRLYLIIFPALAFLLPLINISPVLEKNNWTNKPFVSVIPQLTGYKQTIMVPETVSDTNSTAPQINYLVLIVLAGAAVMLIRLLCQYLSLLAMRRSSQLLLNGPVKVYQVNKPVIPFSFGNAIFLNQHLHDEEELKDIIRHEFIHVKQRHTIDIIWSEAICILTWYNPFSWLLRKSIRQNLEFIADQQVLKTGLDRRQYQYLLLKVIGVPSFSIASNFNFKSLKKRIAMMNKVNSARVHLVRFLLLLPLVAVILLAFRNAAKHRQLPPREVAISDTTPVKKYWPENVESFHSNNNQVTVTLKNGKVEKYNLNKEDELAAFEKKYGKMPDPPTPPAAPVIVLEAPHEPIPAIESIATPLPAPAPESPVLADEHFWRELAPLQDDCFNDKGYCVGVIQTRKGSMVLVQHKTKKETALIYLDDWKNDKKYEEKYGKLLVPPPPPPAPMHPPVADEHVPEEVLALTKDIDGIIAEHMPDDAEEQEIIAVITEKTSLKDFERLKESLRQKGITFELKNTKYNDGKLVLFEAWFREGSNRFHYIDDNFNAITISRTSGKDGQSRFHIYPVHQPVHHQ